MRRRLLEHRDELRVGLAGGRVGDEAELGVRASLGSRRTDPGCGSERRGDEHESSGECDETAVHWRVPPLVGYLDKACRVTKKTMKVENVGNACQVGTGREG